MLVKLKMMLLICLPFLPLISMAEDDNKLNREKVSTFMEGLCRDQKKGLPKKYFPKEGIQFGAADCDNRSIEKTLKPDALSGLCGLFVGTQNWKPTWEITNKSGNIYTVNFNGGNAVIKVNAVEGKLLEMSWEYCGHGSGD